MMKWSNVNVPLGLGMSPIVTIPKESATAAIIAGTAGAGLISGLANMFSQADTNKTNRQIAEQNRDWQSQENRLSEQWQERMWNLTNQYNTPSAMRTRTEAAGYNPFLFDGSKLAGSGSGASMPSVPSKQSAPDMPTQKALDMSFIGDAAQRAVSQYYNAKGVEANVANQLADAHKKEAEGTAIIYDSLGPEAAKKYANTIGYSMDDSSPMVRRTELNLEGIDLANTKKSLENHLVRTYGDKSAEAKIANLEGLTTKYFGELGLMSARADLSRSEIELNKKKAYALGAQMARDFAQARLFGSEASINEGICNYVIQSADYKSQSDYIGLNQDRINYSESFARYTARDGVRSYMMSPEGQSRQLWNYKQSPEGNYVSSFINGFTNAANVSIGLNGNLSRSWSTSGSINTTNVFSYHPGY